MPVDALSATFAALADPTRRAILAQLAEKDTAVGALAKPFDMSLPAVSKHLKVLERAGLIVRGREAQWRPCRLEPAALKGVDDWLERYRLLWEERLDRLGDYLDKIQGKDLQVRSQGLQGQDQEVQDPQAKSIEHKDSQAKRKKRDVRKK